MDTISSDFPLHEELANEDVFFWDIPFESSGLSNSMLDEQPLLTTSAFVKYIKPNYYESPIIIDNGRKNVHHRLVETVREMRLENNECRTSNRSEYSRGFRHMMRERQRREKLSQSYADLRSMLPYSSKADKISIVQSAAAYVKDRNKVKEELLKRNGELKLAKVEKENKQGPKIKICLADHTCALDSMIAALKRLKEMNVEAISIQTQFSDSERTAIVSIENKVGVYQMQKAVENSEL